MSEKDVLRNIRRIDKNRSRLRELISGKDRGDSSMFDLVVNSGGWDMNIKQMVPAVAEYAEKWFARKEA